MTIRPIIRYPDPRLALPAQPVAAFDGALRELAGDLLETMHAAPVKRNIDVHRIPAPRCDDGQRPSEWDGMNSI